jgi:hypothetical protein
MSIKSVRIHKDSRGFAHLALILLILGVAGVGGFAYWRVSSYNNNDGANGRATNDESGNNTATLSDECVEQTGDENICRLGAISDISAYSSEVHMTTQGGDGPLTSILKFDGKGNHSVDTGTGLLGMSVGGKYYIYMDKWYDSGNDSSQAPASSVPSFGFATTAGITYENQGKVPCGDDTCFKYRMSGGILGDGVITCLFGDEDFLPRTYEATGGLTGNLSMTIEYKEITITAPEGALPISSYTGM